MASDIYQYEVLIGVRKIFADACDIEEAFDVYSFYELDSQGNWVRQLDPDDAQDVMNKIKEGVAKLRYLGGWCSDGRSWTSDGVHHNYHDELKRFHDSLEE